MATTTFKYLLMLGIVLTGIIGAYDFVTSGLGSPLVWALDGDLAPLFWISVFGILISALWPTAKIE
jgi:hypothetical protein